MKGVVLLFAMNDCIQFNTFSVLLFLVGLISVCRAGLLADNVEEIVQERS